MSIAFHRRCLAAVSLLILLATLPAHANDVNTSINYGGTKTGTITKTGHDDYTFTAAEGATFVASLAETGKHNSHYIPRVELIPPGQTEGTALSERLHTQMRQANAAAGEWTIRVSRLDEANSSGGTYALKLVHINGTGTSMTLGQDYNGANTRGGVDLYTFTGTANQAARLAVRPTGGEGFIPQATLFTPSGAEFGFVYCDGVCSADMTLPANGTYTLMVSKYDDRDVSGNYAVSVSNNQ